MQPGSEFPKIINPLKVIGESTDKQSLIPFNQPINTQQVTVNDNTYIAWNVSKVTNMYGMFDYKIYFNQPLTN